MKFDDKAFERDLRFATARLKRGAAAFLDKASQHLADTMRANAPVETGKTKESIKVSNVRRRKRSIVQDVSAGQGDERNIIGSIEYGTSDTEPNAFMRKSAEEAEPRMIEIIESGLPR